MNELEENKESRQNKQIIRSWLSGNCSCTLVIPKVFARDIGLDKPSNVIIEKTRDGLLIKKLNI